VNPGSARSEASNDRPAEACVSAVPVVVGLIVMTAGAVAACVGDAAAAAPARARAVAASRRSTAVRAMKRWPSMNDCAGGFIDPSIHTRAARR